VTAWKHDDLARDLAQYLRSDKRMVWTDMQLGPSGSARPDVFTLEKSYSNPLPTAYECKISRSDLRSDTTSGKWQKYLQFAGAVIFAVPDGLCTAADIPVGCGLIVRKDQVWRHVRRATRQKVTLPMDACMKLLIDGLGRMVTAVEPQPRRIELWRECEAVRRKFGEAVAKAARDLAAARQDIISEQAVRTERWQRMEREVEVRRKYLMEQAQKEAAAFEVAKRDLVEWLRLDGAPSLFGVQRAIQQLRAACDSEARVLTAEQRVTAARHALEAALRSLPAAPQSEAA
jgi:hypothetical protein